MKNLFTTLFLVAIVSSAFATVRTVSNNVNSPGQYTSFATCVTACSNGDTIYLHPSNTSYGSVTITKKLTIFGAGYDGRTYETRQIATTGTIILGKNGIISTSSGTQLIGLYISGYVYVNTDTIFNVTISRCRVTNYIEPVSSSSLVANTNWSIVNSSISGIIYMYQSANNLIANNFLASGIQTSSGSSINMVTNNVFMGNYSGSLNNCYNVIFTNNIFFNTSANTVIVLNANASGNVFNNNLSYNFSGTMPPVNNSGANNINNTNPQFISAPIVGQTLNYDSIISWNWHLNNASPGHNAGSDGTDIGVYGSTFSFLNVAGVSSLPQVILLDIQNPAIPANGTLNVTSTGIRRD